jgi:membrane fusion protein, multidrug efflux system
MYANVALTLPYPHKVWELPATSVMTNARGIRVAVVQEGKLHLVPVTVERDNGATIEISHGITETDQVVRLGSADLTEVRPVEIAK